ncbi:hypothetical protein N9S84_00950 [Nitrosomonadales bacterium]|jgi:hypothetical protein|nr:hypothetical protein [Nitrosomonadales bacterium]
MTKFNYTFFLLLLISANSFSQEFQYLISERYYNYSDNVRPSAYGEWYTFRQGPMLEEAVNRSLKSGVKKCVPGSDSDYIFSLEPNIFYNYQMDILYGQLKVKIFGPRNVLKDSVTIEIEHQTRIHQKANYYINKIYDELVKKLDTEILSKLPKDNLKINGDFCTTIELSRPQKKIDPNYKAPIQA